MIWIRDFTSGWKHDVRSKIFAEFKCDNCKELHQIDITGFSKTFNREKQRKCPKCGYIGKEDKIQQLKIKYNLLIEEKEKITKQIENIIEELNSEILNEVEI